MQFQFKNSNFQQLQSDWNSSSVALPHKDNVSKGLRRPSDDKEALNNQNLVDLRLWNFNDVNNESCYLAIHRMSDLSNVYENRLWVMLEELVMDCFERNGSVSMREENEGNTRAGSEFHGLMLHNYRSKGEDKVCSSKILQNVNDLVEEAKFMAMLGHSGAKRKPKCLPESGSVKLDGNVLLCYKFLARLGVQRSEQISGQRMSQNTRRIRLQMRRKAEERYNALISDDSSDENLYA